MTPTTSLGHRLGAVIFTLAGILFALGLTHPDDDPAAIAASVSSAGWFWGHLALIISHILLIFGVLTLYAVLAQGAGRGKALVASVLSIAGAALSLPMFGVLGFALPILGESGAVEPIQRLLASPFLAAFLGGGSLLLAIGAILYVLATRQSESIGSGPVIIYTIGLVILLGEPVLGQFVRSVVGLLIVLGSAGIAWSIWNSPLTKQARQMPARSSAD